MMLKNQNEDGFTLVELLIVVAIIGVLAAVTAPSLNKMVTRSQGREFARGVAQQYRFARNQAANTNRVLLVALFEHDAGSTWSGINSNRGRVEVWATADHSICRDAPSTVASAPPGYEMVSFFEGKEVSGSTKLYRNSTGPYSSRSIVCVQPNGEFLRPGDGNSLQKISGVGSQVCLGEAMVIATYDRDIAISNNDIYKCAISVSDNVTEKRDAINYWRISLWDNGQVTVGNR